MSVLVVGSIAYDSVQTPFGMSEETLGGSATYFSFSASFLTQVRLVGVVGKDFKEEYIGWMKDKGIDTAGLEIVDGETFRWSGKYEGDMNTAETLSVDLNVFGEFDPKLPEDYKKSEYVFLANGHPELQKKVLSQVESPKLVVADTMNLWIENATDSLKELITMVDGLIINDGEAKMLTGQHLTVAAGHDIMGMGPKFIVVKKGEHGALLFYKDDTKVKVFAVPSYPLSKVLDPTGAGDSFAGGFMGSLAKDGTGDLASMKRAVIYGTVLASHNVEGFSLSRFREISKEDVENRYNEFVQMLKVD